MTKKTPNPYCLTVEHPQGKLINLTDKLLRQVII